MLGKPTASLSSGLLARKGHARPAMRPQGYMSLSPASHEDLGWNDMGDMGGDEAAQAYQQQAHPQPIPVEPEFEAPEDLPAPPVLRQRAELEEQIAPQPEPAPFVEPEPFTPVAVPAVRAPQPVSAGTLARVARQAKATKSKAAFTLRLDHDRHLRLRLASAVRNHSAQQLVTEALDAFLDSLPDVDALARQLAAKGK